MHELYIICQQWQLEHVRSLLKDDENVTTNSYCFRPNTYVVESIQTEARCDQLATELMNISVTIPLQ